jgi:hypothetical protein
MTKSSPARHQVDGEARMDGPLLPSKDSRERREIFTEQRLPAS